MTGLEKEKVREKKQAVVDKSKSIEERRARGQFATPFTLAQEIVSHGLNLMDEAEVAFLEPSLGTGAFYSALLQETNNTEKTVKRATGIEIDADYYQSANQLWCSEGLHLLNEDFTRAIPDAAYNLLITNPPYVRHHYISQEEKIRLSGAVREELGLDVSGLSGLYCYFMLLSHKWLSPGAICGWLIPSEFMDVNYGKAMKSYLLNNVRLLRVHRYSPSNSKFEDALVSSCVVWFKNEHADCDYDVEFTYGGSHNDPLHRKYVSKSLLLNERKWTRFPEKDARIMDKEAVTIGDYFTVKRGIATGNNNFFILEKEKIIDLGIDMSFFRPILPSPRKLKTDYIEADKIGNPNTDPQCFLLDCDLTETEVESLHPALWEYLQSGITETSSKYLCRSRKTWFWQEKRNSTHFLCSYMGRGSGKGSPIRFILNQSDAIATNSYLMLYPKGKLQEALSKNTDLEYEVWEALKAITSSEIEDEGRIYGGGLKKIEPKELSKVRCAALSEIIGMS